MFLNPVPHAFDLDSDLPEPGRCLFLVFSGSKISYKSIWTKLKLKSILNVVGNRYCSRSLSESVFINYSKNAPFRQKKRELVCLKTCVWIG